ncbi:Ppx/GppA phosphatase family protein [Terrarubrum flagellatum]|uniref:Ppx/GppA phosphatase family protein n=1 Tax=Terrirubrum flagellatum TaxID=2895980 RepID=UPI003144EA52
MAPFTESGLAEAAPRHEPPPARASAPKQVYAALDLGTNNCRLLVATPTDHGFSVIDAFSRIVRLGEGLGRSNQLSEAAIRRTMAALRICRDKMRARRVTRAHMIATQACRMAENGSRFVERVRRELNLSLDIVDQRTEAHLAAAGCEALADPNAGNLILFDIGGGSSEIVWLDRSNCGGSLGERVRCWTSLPLGVVTLAERYGGECVTDEQFELMVAEADRALAPFKEQVAPLARCRNFHLLGTSGTVTTIAGVFLDLQRYDRRRVDGLWMRNCEVDSVMARLRRMPYDLRALNGCIGRDRADLVLAGCAILEAIRRAFPSERLRIADRGLREGLLTQMMAADRCWSSAERQV